MNGANMEEIVKMAQQVASNIATNQTEPIDPKNMDMSKVLSQVTESVSKMMTPELLEKMSGGNMENINQNIEVPKDLKTKSKIKFDKSSINELNESDTDLEIISRKTKDLHFTLNVTLEELYSGKVKKLAVRRKKVVTDGKHTSQVEEKKKIAINIEPGMYDEQIIVFAKQADEKRGYEPGDIIITLCCAEHDEFERENNNLLVEKEISLYEAYNCKMTITHLNGSEINVHSSPINVFGEELECYRKLKNHGMPILGSENSFGDLIIKFKLVMPDNITEEQMNMLKELFPPINNIKGNSEHELEMVAESDFEFSDSEEDEDEDEDSDYSSDDSDDSSESSNSNKSLPKDAIQELT